MLPGITISLTRLCTSIVFASTSIPGLRSADPLSGLRYSLSFTSSRRAHRCVHWTRAYRFSLDACCSALLAPLPVCWSICWQRNSGGKRVALITGCIAAVYTGLFIYDGWLYTESLYTFLQTAFLFALYQLQRTRQRRWIVFSGLALGLAALERPNGAILIVMLALWCIVMGATRGLGWRSVLKNGLAITCIAAALVAPWIYRNYLVTHSFVVVTVGEGDVLLGAYNDRVLNGTTGFWIALRDIEPRPDLPAIVLAGHDAEHYTPQDDKIATDYTLHWIASHWRDIPRLVGEHFISMWTPYTPEENLPFRQNPGLLSSQIVWFMTICMPIPIFLLALFGAFVTWRRWKRELLVGYIMIALVIAQNLIFYGNMRFRSSIEPLLVLLTGGALWWLTGDEAGTLRYRRLQRRASPATIGNAVPIVQPKSTRSGSFRPGYPLIQ